MKSLRDPLRRMQHRLAPKHQRGKMARHRHNTLWFVLRETILAFQRHQDLRIAAALAFYAMFALIPLALLMLFLLSQLVFSYDYAIVKLAILTSNLVPDLSQHIMVEVYNISTKDATWGAVGMLAMLWASIPLTRALRASFHTISAVAEPPSMLRRSVTDLFAVLGILLLLFLFTLSGTMLERVLEFMRPEFVSVRLIHMVSSFITLVVLLTAIYHMFFPARIALHYTILGAVLTAALWLMMRPAFELFLFLRQDYGAMFGSMKNLFISVAWLYCSFAVFLLGTELIATLRRQEVLMLRGLFGARGRAIAPGYLDKLMQLFGRVYAKGEHIFRRGEVGRDMYYIVDGRVAIAMDGKTLSELGSGECFGEMAVFAGATRATDAIVVSELARVLAISADNIETLLREEPRLAMSFVRAVAMHLHEISITGDLAALAKVYLRI